MRAYHERLAAIVRPGRVPTFDRDSPEIYAFFVRLQHRQPLRAIYGSVADVATPSVDLERLFDAYIEAHPPRDSHPARWTLGFAQFLADRSDVSAPAKERADFAALRTAQSIALDESPDHRGTLGDVRAYDHDPRTAAVREAPVTVLVFRDADGLVRACDIDASMVAAWGVVAGETTPDALAARGLDGATLASGHAKLGGIGHPFFAAR